MSFKSLIERWPIRADLAREVGATDNIVQQWSIRDNIPANWFPQLVAAAHKRGFKEVTFEALARMSAERVQRRRQSA